MVLCLRDVSRQIIGCTHAKFGLRQVLVDCVLHGSGLAVQADMQIALPILRLKVVKESMRKLAHKHHELVQP